MQKRITLLAIFALLRRDCLFCPGRKAQSGSIRIVRSRRRKDHQNELLQPTHEGS